MAEIGMPRAAPKKKKKRGAHTDTKCWFSLNEINVSGRGCYPRVTGQQQVIERLLKGKKSKCYDMVVGQWFGAMCAPFITSTHSPSTRYALARVDQRGRISSADI